MVTSCIFPINEKGGTGKTTISTDILCELAKYFNVLGLDTDHQGAMYKTLTGISRTLPDDEKGFYNEFMASPVERVLIKPGMWEPSYYNHRYYVDFPKSADLSYFPVELYQEEEYAEGFKEIIEGLVKDKHYDFVIADLPGFRARYGDADHIVKTHENFTNLIPLIVTGATKHETNLGLNSYKEFIKRAQKHDTSIEDKLKPIIVINKYSEKEHGQIDIETDIPVFFVPNQPQCSATRTKYGYQNDPEYNPNHTTFDDMDETDSVDMILSMSYEDINSSFGSPSPEKQKQDEMQNDFRKYFQTIEGIVYHIQKVTETEPTKFRYIDVSKGQLLALKQLHNLSKKPVDIW